MGDTIKGLEFLGVSATIVAIRVGILLVLQIVGKIMEFYGKTVPALMRIFQRWSQKRNEKQETAQTLKEVKQLVADFNSHYSADNIQKRDVWMQGVDDRAVTCGNQMAEMKDALMQVTQALNVNTKMTEDMFIENSRDRIIDFAEKASDNNVLLSREQFRRVDRVYQDYEKFLKERNRQNGEVDIAYEAIQDGYKYRLQHHSFLEDIKGYQIK